MAPDRDYKQLIRERVLDEERFVRATFSGARAGQSVPWTKVVLRPVEIRGSRHVQFSYFDSQKDISKNYRGPEIAGRLEELLDLGFKNYHIATTGDTTQITISRRGTPLISTARQQAQPAAQSLSHNRRKRHILAEDEQSRRFLHAVRIAAADGRIKAEMQSKYRQVNEFLRLLDQTGALQSPGDRPLRVADLGCGNAYLTFAAYHYLVEVLGIPTSLVGVDLKRDLIEKHTTIARELGWPGLTFTHGRIIDYAPEAPPDVVLALHACDTATDEAIAQGIGWGSRLIVTAPCCHHHLQAQLDKLPAPPPFAPVLRHGLLRERFGDILTDSFRALLLRLLGYRTDAVQFVDDEHTPRNLMIRAVRGLAPGEKQFVREYLELKRFWGVTPYLEELLGAPLAALLE